MDSNGAYVDSLAFDEQAAYFEALYGTPEQQAYLDEVAQAKFEPDTVSALESLMSEEIALAVAGLECEGTYQDQWQDIQDDIMDQYVLDHEGELRAIAAQFLATEN